MLFRIQSQKSRAIDILKRGLDDLSALCDHTLDVFSKEIKKFETDKLDSGSEEIDGDVEEEEEAGVGIVGKKGAEVVDEENEGDSNSNSD